MLDRRTAGCITEATLRRTIFSPALPGKQAARSGEVSRGAPIGAPSCLYRTCASPRWGAQYRQAAP